MIRIVTDGYIERLVSEREERLRKENYYTNRLDKLMDDIYEMKVRLRKIEHRVACLEVDTACHASLTNGDKEE